LGLEIRDQSTLDLTNPEFLEMLMIEGTVMRLDTTKILEQINTESIPIDEMRL
jgi:hypothetical protein